MKSLPDDCTVRLIDLPISVGGRISECPDGHLDIYINARHAHDARLRDLGHELNHWKNNDLRNGLDIRDVESRNTRKLPKLIRARDLLPKDPPKPALRRPLLSPHQARVLTACLADLDAAFNFDIPDLF